MLGETLNIGSGAFIVDDAVVAFNAPDREIWGGIPARKIGEADA